MKAVRPRCPACPTPLDPAAAPVHPACEQTASAATIRCGHISSLLRGFTNSEWARITGHRRLRARGYQPKDET